PRDRARRRPDGRARGTLRPAEHGAARAGDRRDSRRAALAVRRDPRRPGMATALIRVAIVDDHPVVRDGTAALLAAQDGLEVVGTAGSIDEASALLERTPVDVLLLDIRLGTDSGLRLLSGAERRKPAVVVL